MGRGGAQPDEAACNKKWTLLQKGFVEVGYRLLLHKGVKPWLDKQIEKISRRWLRKIPGWEWLLRDGNTHIDDITSIALKKIYEGKFDREDKFGPSKPNLKSCIKRLCKLSIIDYFKELNPFRKIGSDTYQDVPRVVQFDFQFLEEELAPSPDTVFTKIAEKREKQIKERKEKEEILYEAYENMKKEKWFDYGFSHERYIGIVEMRLEDYDAKLIAQVFGITIIKYYQVISSFYKYVRDFRDKE